MAAGQDHKADFVSLKELAATLGMDRSHCRRYVLSLGYKPKKRRTPDSQNQLTLTVSRREADAITAMREQQGFLANDRVVEGEAGAFYVILLAPDLSMSRIKLGFANNVNERLQQHRTAAPTAELLKQWPCKRSWEKTVVDCLTQSACRLVANEVFDCDETDALLARGDRLFEQLPKPTEQG